MFAINLGEDIYDEPFNGLYFAVFKYSLIQWSIAAPVSSWFVKFSIHLSIYSL